MYEGLHVTIGNPAFCLFFYFSGVHFRGELQHVGDVSQQKIKFRTIIAQELGGVTLSDVLWGTTCCNFQPYPIQNDCM